MIKNVRLKNCNSKGRTNFRGVDEANEGDEHKI